MNERHEAIFEQRARALAKVQELRNLRLRGNETVVLEVSPVRLGLPIRALREIVRAVDITPLPGVPAWMLGLALLRGELVVVIDLSAWWGLGPPTQRGALAIVAGDRGPLGIAVDSVLEVRRVEDTELEAGLGAESSAKHRCVHGVTRDLVHLVDVDALTTDPELDVGADPIGVAGVSR